MSTPEACPDWLLIGTVLRAVTLPTPGTRPDWLLIGMDPGEDTTAPLCHLSRLAPNRDGSQGEQK